jgi:transcriptional regulator of acetoin/glycerol metabolism
MSNLTPIQRTPADLPMSTPRSHVHWRLHVLASPDPAMQGKVLDLTPGRTDFGRESPLQIGDPLLSRCHAALIVGDDHVRVVDDSSRNGTFVGGQRTTRAWAGHGAVLRFGHTLAVLEADMGRAMAFDLPTLDVPGRSELARVLRGELDLAARSHLTTLLVGETGTGKEHAAQELHRRSGRKGALVRFNVAAVPQELFESELVGHVTGAFTGAGPSRPGRLREAHGGTLVLDEIGELPEAMQAKLLRLLEDGVVRPLGGHADVPVDVRFIASTNADLESMVRNGRFRRDLLARLRSHVVQLPRLGDRLPDLFDLADAVLGRPDPSWRTRLAVQAGEVLLLHDWPDNLRELRAVLGRAVLLAGHTPIASSHLPDTMRRPAEPESTPTPPAMPSYGRPSAMQLRGWLHQYRGNIDAIARHVRRHRRQVYRWLHYAGLGVADVEASRLGGPADPVTCQPGDEVRHGSDTTHG